MNYGPNMKPVGEPIASGNLVHVRVVTPEMRITIDQLATQYMDAFNRGVPVKSPQAITAEVLQAIAIAAEVE